MPKFSIVIPAYEMHGIGADMLKRCLRSIEKQTYRNFEIVVSDNCVTDEILNVCEKFGRIRYVFNPKIGNSSNRNSAMHSAKGELIKILDQDDYFADENSLQDIIDNFKEKDVWMITGCSNNPHPYYREDANTLGSPTTLTLKNNLNIWFNESLNWMLDLDFYRRLYAKYGTPKILDKINVIIGLHPNQATNKLTDKEKNEEYIRFAADHR